MTPYMNVMIKPASGMCNLRCRYCFYADEAGKRDVANYGMMSLETLETVIRKCLANTTNQCTISFQGGEPTLAGLDFFRQMVGYVERYNVNHCIVQFALQTNATLLDEEWCAFLKEYDFLVGVSLDGTKDIHDANRVDANGEGTYKRVLQSIKLLERYKVEFNILTVLTSDLCRRFRKVYSGYAKNGWTYQQYIPCLDPLEETRGQHPWSLTPERFEQYLKSAFDCWFEDVVSGKPTSHRYFDNLVLIMDGQHPEACGMGGSCGLQYVVEADGSVYPCDFYVLDRYRLGNLNTDDFDALDQARRENGFVTQSQQLHEDCGKCQWLNLCRGGCRRDRDFFEAGLDKNYYCPAYRAFFDYAYPRLIKAYRYLMRGY